MSLIHATAIVDAKAQLDASVQVGPYSIIGPHVKVDAGTTIGAAQVAKAEIGRASCRERVFRAV